MRLRTKFAIVFIAVTLILSGSIFVALEFNKRDAVGESRANVNETATLVAEQIDAAIRDRRDYVGLVASRPRARQFHGSGEFLDAFLANSRFYAVQILAANGTVIDFRGDITGAQQRAVLGSNRSNASYVRAALAGQSYVGEAESVDREDAHILVFSAPIIEGGEVKGVLAAALYLDTQTIFDVLSPLETSRQAVTVSGNGMELHGNDRAFPASVEATATVDSTGWAVTVARDRSALDVRLRRLALFQAGQLGLVVLVMVGFGYWQYATSLRQTERLLDGFADLGAGDYGRSISLRGGAEWEQIGDGFNDMVATLKAREAALRERTQRLEVMYRVLRHNLRNQLSVILTYGDIIADVTDDDQVYTGIQSILDAGRTLTDLSERARQIETALEADQEPTQIEVSGIVSEIVANLDETYPAVEIRTSLPEAAWAVSLPSLRLAIENVCENACKHNDADNPRVDVSVETIDRVGGTPADEDSIGCGGTSPLPPEDDRSDERPLVDTSDRERSKRGDSRDFGSADDGWVRIAVADNGPGIPEQDRAAIREGRETDLEHASGLGLWLTYWIVDSSGGDLRFEDVDPRGTVVEIVLPWGVRASDDGSATGLDSIGIIDGTRRIPSDSF